MLGKKRQRSMIGKLSELLVSGTRGSLIEDGSTSPKGPLDLKSSSAQSPRGPKGYSLAGVGLGIVAAMEKTQVRTRSSYCICNPTRVLNKLGSVGGDSLLEEGMENYTYVTCYNGPNYEPCTRAYTADGREYCSSASASASMIGDELMRTSESKEVIEVFPTSEFMRSCLSCGKKLKGEDIYMYRGEKAFCSTECRSRQITMDERKERCRSVNLSSSRGADL